MNNLPTIPASTSISPPIGTDRSVEDLVAAWRNVIERQDGRATLPQLPSLAQRRLMETRREKVRQALRPISMAMADKQRAAAAITALLTGWIHAGKSDAKSTVAAYVMHLQDLPAFAIERACFDVAKGYVDGLSPDFPPSAPRLHQLGIEACLALRQEAAKIDEVLTAELRREPTEQERERVKIGLQTLADDLRDGEDAVRKANREAASAQLDEANRRVFERDCKAAGIDPAGGVSPALLKSVGHLMTSAKPASTEEAA